MSAKVEVPFSGLTNAEMFAEPAPVAASVAAPVAEPVTEAVADPKAKPKKTLAKPRAKKVAKSEETVTEDAEDAEPAEPTTPKAPAKRGRASKKNATPGPNTPGAAEGDEMAVDTPVKTAATKTPKKRATPAKADGETPAKKPKAAPKGSSFPTCWDEFSEEDKLIVTMRRAGTAWPAIETEWEKITKRNPGKDVIRKRFARLEAVAQVFKVGDAAILASAKVKVEKSIEEQIKKLNADKWTSIANTMKEDGADVYKPAAIEKKFESMMKNGEIGASGEYIGPEVNGAASAPEDGSADGDDTEMKDAADAKAEEDDADEEGA